MALPFGERGPHCPLSPENLAERPEGTHRELRTGEFPYLQDIAGKRRCQRKLGLYEKGRGRVGTDGLNSTEYAACRAGRNRRGRQRPFRPDPCFLLRTRYWVLRAGYSLPSTPVPTSRGNPGRTPPG